MIITKIGNVLDISQGIIVHGCNCRGVMGAGIAKQIKIRYPIAYDIYIDEHRTKGLYLGRITQVEVEPNKIIVNANTQQDYGAHTCQVDYYAVEVAFRRVNELAKYILANRGIVLDVCFPALGAGLGGGNWQIISEIIDRSVDDIFNKTLFILE